MNTTNEMLKAVRKEARENGMVFKVDNNVSLNGATAYKFCNRECGSLIESNFTLSNAYENTLSGYVKTLAP